MGQKANPIGNRLGIIRGWESNWYSKQDTFAQKLIEDTSIRSYIRKRTSKAGIAKIVIERTLGKIIITIHTSKPGIIIGKGGGEVDGMKEELKKITKNKDIQINIIEVKRPELDAYIVAETIAQQIENRVNFKRAAKMAIASTMRAGAEGIKIKLSGRLAGAEIARSEELKEGRVPLHTYRMDIDYASLFAMTVYGKIGIKVWICRGEVLTSRELDLNFVHKAAGFGNNPAGGPPHPRFDRRRSDERTPRNNDNRRPRGAGGEHQGRDRNSSFQNRNNNSNKR